MQHDAIILIRGVICACFFFNLIKRKKSVLLSCTTNQGPNCIPHGYLHRYKDDILLPKTRRSYRKCTIYSSVYLDKVEVFVIVLDKVRLVLDALHGGVGVEGQLREPAAEPSVMMNNKNIN